MKRVSKLIYILLIHVSLLCLLGFGQGELTGDPEKLARTLSYLSKIPSEELMGQSKAMARLAPTN